jgi:uncharacterized LabA/DUF88 family protein
VANRRTMVFIDGENLTLRYQNMLAAQRTPTPQTIHKQDVYAWNPSVLQVFPNLEILRITYYTYAVGTEEQIDIWANELKQNSHTYRADRNDFAFQVFLNPRIFKKRQRSAKRKGVDISIAVDSLTLAFNDSIDIVFLITGDGDYVPLIDALMRAGKQVYLAALSDGLNSQLPNIVDRFACLDNLFFNAQAE